MLETILDRHIVFVLLGILAAVGIMSKFIVNVALKRLVRAAGNMNKSTHPLMRLVRAKFEHASMVSDKVENVKVFVDKYLYEYKVLGLKLHSWRRMEKAAAALCLLVGAAGAGLEYGLNGMSDLVWKTGAVGGGLGAFVYLVHLLTDEKYQLDAVRNYMVDFLENVCRHRFEKSYHKEIKVLAQDGSAAEFGAMPAEDQGHDGDSYAVREKETAEDLYAVRNLELADESLYAGKLQKQEDDRLYTERSQKPAKDGVYNKRGQKPAEDGVYGERSQKPAEENLYTAKQHSQTDEDYAVRKREQPQGQSAVSAFLAAELKAGESVFRDGNIESDDSVNTFRTADLRVDEVANAFHAFQMPQPERNEGNGTFRVSEERKKEAVEIEAPGGREKRKENIVEIPAPDPGRESMNPVVVESPEPSSNTKNSQIRQSYQKERMPRKERTQEEADRDVVIRRILEEFMA